MKLLALNQSRDRVPRAWLEKWIHALSLKLASRGVGLDRTKELVLVFVNPSEMKRLNKLYRGKNYATDVLSFETKDSDALGELVLCWPTIRAQSRRTGLSARGELGYMVIHGVLHLLGYDHGDRESEARMFALQDQIYAELEKSVGFI
jgi:probable rRNA maturation factor